jgi:hypothetical protein
VCVCVCVCVSVRVCARAYVCTKCLGNARSMNTSLLSIFCSYAAKVHVAAVLQVVSAYRVLKRPGGIRVPSAILHECEELCRGNTGNKH